LLTTDVFEETSEYRKSRIPEAKNRPPITAKDIKDKAVFQHRLNASTTKPRITRAPEIRSLVNISFPSQPVFIP